MAAIPSDGQLVLYSEPATASCVSGNLWVGSAPPIGGEVGKFFDCLVLAAQEYQLGPDAFGVEVMNAPMNDDGTPITKGEMEIAVRAAGRVIAWLGAGKRVLVTCHKGRNRSGLVAALALCRGPAAAHPDEAIAAIRMARGPGAMSNPYFVWFLRRYCLRSE